MRVEPWNGTYGREVATWHYEPPYDFYDLASDPHDEAEMCDPAHAAHYRAVLAEGDDLLDAFWYFNWQGDVVDVGIGLRPAADLDSYLGRTRQSGSCSTFNA